MVFNGEGCATIVYYRSVESEKVMMKKGKQKGGKV